MAAAGCLLSDVRKKKLCILISHGFEFIQVIYKTDALIYGRNKQKQKQHQM